MKKINKRVLKALHRGDRVTAFERQSSKSMGGEREILLSGHVEPFQLVYGRVEYEDSSSTIIDSVAHLQDFRFNGMEWGEYKTSLNSFAIMVGRDRPSIDFVIGVLKRHNYEIPVDLCPYDCVWIGVVNGAVTGWINPVLRPGWYDGEKFIHIFYRFAYSGDWPIHIKKLSFLKNFPKEGQGYYVPDPTQEDWWIWVIYDNNAFDRRMINRGLMCLTAEQAIERAKKML